MGLGFNVWLPLDSPSSEDNCTMNITEVMGLDPIKD